MPSPLLCRILVYSTVCRKCIRGEAMCNMMFFSVVLTQGLLLLAISIIVFNLLAQRPHLSSSSSSTTTPASHKISLPGVKPALVKKKPAPPAKDPRHDKFRDFMCEDDEAVSSIQKELWMKAYVDVFKGGMLPHVNDKDVRFYQEAYGTVNLHLPYNRHNFSEMVYYRIYKVGNDNIRSFLFEYAFNQTNTMSEYYELGCPADRCRHPWVTRGHMPYLRARAQPFPPNRFAFTFVRHPIVRFISAMNEVETRAHGNEAKQRMLSLQSPVGSLDRVMEFIRMILKTGASGDFYRIYEAIEFNHLAPMYGTLSLARGIESTPLHVYKLEQLGAEWKRLSQELGDGLMSRIYIGRKKRKEWFIHASASDFLNITRAAMSLFSPHTPDLYEQNYFRENKRHLLYPLETWPNYRQYRSQSSKYLRALCRIYFVDFVCGGYALPEHCNSIYQEVEDVVSKLQKNIACNHKPSECD